MSVGSMWSKLVMMAMVEISFSDSRKWLAMGSLPTMNGLQLVGGDLVSTRADLVSAPIG